MNFKNLKPGMYLTDEIAKCESLYIKHIIAHLNNTPLRVDIETVKSIIHDRSIQYNDLLDQVKELTHMSDFSPHNKIHVKKALANIGMKLDDDKGFGRYVLTKLARETCNDTPLKIYELRSLKVIMDSGKNILAFCSSNHILPIYDQNGAITGRITSAKPCISNMAADYRAAIVPEPGNQFVYWDWKNFEVRIQASVSNDEVLIDMFNRDIDLHNFSIAIFLGKDAMDVTPEERNAYKSISLGHWYGLGVLEMMVRSGRTYTEVKNFKNRMNELAHKLVEFRGLIIAEADNTLKLSTPFGRLRVFERPPGYAAWGYFAQATAADYFKIKLGEIYYKLWMDLTLSIPLFDGGLLTCAEDELETSIIALQEIVEENCLDGFCKMHANIGYGSDWEVAETSAGSGV